MRTPFVVVLVVSEFTAGYTWSASLLKLSQVTEETLSQARVPFGGYAG